MFFGGVFSVVDVDERTHVVYAVSFRGRGIALLALSLCCDGWCAYSSLCHQCESLSVAEIEELELHHRVVALAIGKY
jgi:hypothetical protein